MTGHGGNDFLKFQDNEEISSHDIADAFEQMYQKKRYNEIFFMVDTCQANSLYSQLYSPNILATGSSKVGENSYSHSSDKDLGVAVIDAYTHYVLEFMEGINKTSHATLQELFDSIDPAKINSHPGVRSDLFRRPLDKTLITDFFGGVSQVEVVDGEGEAELEEDLEQEAFVPPPRSATPPCYFREAYADPLYSSNVKKEHPREYNHTVVAEQTTTGAAVRKWGAIALLGGLVGWVGLQSS